MKQISLFDKNKDQTQSPDEAKFNFEEAVSPKRKQMDRPQQIEPWLEDTSNPFLNFREGQAKSKKLNPKISKPKQENSPLKQYRSTEKIPISRQSKILPVMNIGKLNTVRKSFSNSKINKHNQYTHLFSNRSQRATTFNSSQLLPQVRKELMIQRKIFLIKSASQNSSPLSSPERKGKIRAIISEVRRM